MLYYLFSYLEESIHFPGASVFQYISFRALLASIISLLITIVFGKNLIYILQRRQVGESIRDLGLEGQMEKKGTPTMGGIIIIAAIVIPTVLVAKINNIYIILLLISVLWMGLIGFFDDYIKVFRKKKDGLAGKFKIIGQIGLGLIVGLTLYFHQEVKIRDYDHVYTYELNENKQPVGDPIQISDADGLILKGGGQISGDVFLSHDVKSTTTTIPFLKNNELDYSKILSFLSKDFTWVMYVLIVVFIVTAVSNGANITDGLDGLAAGTSAIIGLALAIFAYLSGNVIFADYLNIMFIPNSGELVVFCTAFVGACIGFLWYNSYPAQVFMGDTGSLSLGGTIAVLAFTLRKELLIPVLCGVFLIENVSVILQVAYFKYTKKKYGEGRRIFKMSPLHHHYQKENLHESKIVTRFWIVGILLAVLTLATLKLR